MHFWKSYICSNKLDVQENKHQFRTVQQNLKIISLDTGLRLDGLPGLEFRDLIVSVFGNISHISDRTEKPESDERKHHMSHNKIDVVHDIDLVDYERQKSNNETYFPNSSSCSWLFDRINLDPKIQIKYIDTKNQLADILTKGNFTRDEWNHLLNLFNIRHFISTACTAAMAKRAQQESGERPLMNFDRKNAFVGVFFSLIKPGEDLAWIKRS